MTLWKNNRVCDCGHMPFFDDDEPINPCYRCDDSMDDYEPDPDYDDWRERNEYI